MALVGDRVLVASFYVVISSAPKYFFNFDLEVSKNSPELAEGFESWCSWSVSKYLLDVCLEP